MQIDDLEDIKELIAQAENEQVEFKETTGQLERGISLSTTQVLHKHRISIIQVESFLNIVENNTYSVKEMMALLRLKNRSYFSKEYLKPAVEIGVLEPIYPDQPSSPKQKYCLTEKGKAVLKKG